MLASIRFDKVELRPAERQVLLEGQPAALGARAFELLLALIERRDRVVTKDELLDLVWPGLVVEENNLQVQISALRKLLGPSAIATIPGRGYRFTLAAEAPEPTEVPHSLPPERTRFIGRSTELDACEALLRDTRLLTITGIGGAGKTRLAITLARHVHAKHSDGVWFVDLSPLQDASRVVLTVAALFGVHEAPGAPLIARLTQHLAPRQPLIVLDNCEHVLAAAANLVDALLDACPRITCVATSREPLGLAGEQCFALPPLSLAAGDPLASDAVLLFFDRARLVAPGFAPTPEDAVAIADICRRLDGIALAIEMAAGRVKVLSVAQIRDRLDDRFRLLCAGRREVPRHQTLQAAMQWSYDLLAADEQRLLRVLSVFAGGWTLEAAVAVAGDAGDEIETLDRLSRLVDKSLVIVERFVGGLPRYRMLETVRQFALQLLDRAGEGAAARSRHLDHFVAMVRQSYGMPMSAHRLARLDAESENLLAAHAWCDRAEEAAERGLWLVGGLAGFWEVRGSIELGYRVTLAALARPGAQQRGAARCRALCDAAYLGYYSGGFADAREHAEEGLAIAREIDDQGSTSILLAWLGQVLLAVGDENAAGVCLREALSVARSIGDPNRIRGGLLLLGEWHRWMGQLDAADRLFEEYLSIGSGAVPDTSTVAPILNLASVAIARGDAYRARARLQQALDMLEEVPALPRAICTLEVCAALAAFLGEWARAEHYLSAAVLQRARIAFPRETVDEAFLAPWIERIQTALGTTIDQSSDAAGTLDFDDVLGQARAWIARVAT